MAVIVTVMSPASVTTITVSQVTRKWVGSLKERGQTYDEVVESLLTANSNRLTWSQRGRRLRSGEDSPIEQVIDEPKALGP
jgi:hypothetical protein